MVGGQKKKPPCKISSWPGPSLWCYRKYQADLVNSAQRETASSCQSISTHRASPAIAQRNSNHPRSHFLIPGNCWSIVITQRCSHVQHAWKSIAMQNIFCSGENWLCLLAGIKRQPLKVVFKASLFSAVEFVLKTDSVCFDNLLEVKKGGFISSD